MSGKHLNILLADDDEEDRELIEESILSVDPGAVLHQVNDGRAAIDYLEKYEGNSLPDLIILDYNMPQLNGAQVLALLNRMPRYKSTPKVILSTSSASFHIHECLANGAIEYFTKPNTKKELDAIVRKILAYGA
jgi:CheY-like chemotaxis protein